MQCRVQVFGGWYASEPRYQLSGEVVKTEVLSGSHRHHKTFQIKKFSKY